MGVDAYLRDASTLKRRCHQTGDIPAPAAPRGFRRRRGSSLGTSQPRGIQKYAYKLNNLIIALFKKCKKKIINEIINCFVPN